VQLEDADLNDVVLHAGLSVVVTVDTEHHRHLFGSGRAAVAQR
jgi:hypothetical protein